ncbi:MAG: glycosyltransferase family 4 protein [Patescibacteria group bacterium]|jgi:glycosyltransferase involved in cell wall biosynthesis
MKIALIVSTFPPYKGGMGNSAYEIAKILSMENEVTVLTTLCHCERSETERSNPDDEIATLLPSVAPRNDKMVVERIKPTWKIGNGAVLLKLWRKLKEFDVVYLHYPFYGTAEIVWLYKLLHPKTKLIIHFHMDTPNLKWWGKILSLPSRMIKNSLMQRADKIISASLDYVAHSSIREVWKKYPAKFVEIPFGVHLDKFHVLPHDILELQNLRQKHGIGEKDRIILFVGGLDQAHRFKGVDILLQAISNIKYSILNIKIIIVGDGDLREEYKNQAHKLGIDKSVIFAGRVADEELVLHYNLADIFVLPSIDKSEAFGMVLVETMACGVPVMASNLPGVRSVFENGVQGYTVAPNSERHLRAKLEEYLKYPQRRWKMGRAARELVEKRYDWEKIAKNIKDVFNKI